MPSELGRGVDFTVIFNEVNTNDIDRADRAKVKDPALYKQLLGITTPWSVKLPDLSMAEQRVTVALKGSKYAWMKTYADQRSSEAVSFRALNQLNLKTSRAW